MNMPKEERRQDSKRFVDSQKEIFVLSVKAENNLVEREHEDDRSYKKEFLEKVRQILS